MRSGVARPRRDADGHAAAVGPNVDGAVPIGAPHVDLAAASRPSVSGVGWPYRFASPTLMTAARGRSSRASEPPVAPAAPWCPTLSRSTRPTRPAQERLGRQPGVAGQERLERPVLHQEDERVLVEIRAPIAPTSVSGCRTGTARRRWSKRSPGRPGRQRLASRRPRRGTRGRADRATGSRAPASRPRESDRAPPARRRGDPRARGTATSTSSRAAPCRARNGTTTLRPASDPRIAGPASTTTQCPPGVRSAAASPCPTSRKCNASPDGRHCAPSSQRPRSVRPRPPRQEPRPSAALPRPCRTAGHSPEGHDQDRDPRQAGLRFRGQHDAATGHAAPQLASRSQSLPGRGPPPAASAAARGAEAERSGWPGSPAPRGPRAGSPEN